MRSFVALTAAAVLAVSAHQTRAQSSRPEVLTGTVKSDSGIAIPASITVTPAGAGFSAAVTVRANTEGAWTATMPTRAPEYYVTVSALNP